MEDLSANIRRTLNHKKLKGEYCGAFAPYGYKKDPLDKNHLIPDPVAAEVVKDVFKMFNNGMGYQKIAQNLNRRGILTPTNYKKNCGLNFENGRNKEIRRNAQGAIWTVHTIYNMVRNEMYSGTLVQGKTTNLSYKNQKSIVNPKSEWIRIPNTHEPIIDEHTWARTQRKLAYPTKSPGDNSNKHVFAGKVFCGLCNNTMKKSRYKSGGIVRDYFRCRTPWDAPHLCNNTKVLKFEDVEDYITKAINNILSNNFNADLIDIRNVEKQNRISALEQERKGMTELLRRKEAAIETLYMDRVEGVITIERYVSLQEKLESEVAACKVRLTEIEKEFFAEDKKTFEEDRLLKKYKPIKTLTHEIVDEFVDKIVIEPYDQETGEREIKVYWTF